MSNRYLHIYCYLGGCSKCFSTKTTAEKLDDIEFRLAQHIASGVHGSVSWADAQSHARRARVSASDECGDDETEVRSYQMSGRNRSRSPGSRSSSSTTVSLASLKTTFENMNDATLTRVRTLIEDEPAKRGIVY
jgi:hypothetical protein